MKRNKNRFHLPLEFILNFSKVNIKSIIIIILINQGHVGRLDPGARLPMESAGELGADADPEDVDQLGQGGLVGVGGLPE